MNYSTYPQTTITDLQSRQDPGRTHRVARRLCQTICIVLAAILLLVFTRPQHAFAQDVSIYKNLEAPFILPGEPVSYSIEFMNMGVLTATNTLITDIIPPELTDITVSSSGFPVTQTGTNPYTWEVGNLPPETGGLITVTGIINTYSYTTTSITNTVTITAVNDVDAGNNNAEVVHSLMSTCMYGSSAGEGQGIYIIDQDSGDILKRLNNSQYRGLAFNSHGQLFGAPRSGSALHQLDPDTGTVLKSVPLTDWVGDLAVHPLTDQVYGYAPDLGIVLIDTVTGAFMSHNIPFASNNNNTPIAFGTDGTLYAINNNNGGELYAFAPDSNSTPPTVIPLDFSLGGNPWMSGFGVRPTDGTLFVTIGGGDSIYTIDPQSGLVEYVGDTDEDGGHDITFDPRCAASDWTHTTIFKRAVPDVALAGDTVSYILTIHNAGTITATDVVVSDVIPAQFTVSNVSTSGLPMTQIGTPPNYEWDLGDIPPLSADGVITITGVVEQHPSFTNTATVDATSNITTLMTTADAMVTMPSQLTVVKDALPDSADDFTFSLERLAPVNVSIEWTSLGVPGDSFCEGEGVVVAADGTVYASDNCNDHIVIINSDGTFRSEINNGNDDLAGQLGRPQDLAIDETLGRLYVADSSNERIDIFDLDGNFVEAWGWDVIPDNAVTDAFEICTTATGCQRGDNQNLAGIEVEGTFGDIQGIDIDAAGNVYVSDTWFHRVQVFGSDGNFLRMWGEGVATGANAFEICTSNCQIGLDSGGSVDGSMDEPMGVAVGPNGNVYVIDDSDRRVQVYDNDGNFIASWGYGVATGANQYEVCIGGCQPASSDNFFDDPKRIDVDDRGLVYVVDEESAFVQIFDPNGVPVSGIRYDGLAGIELCNGLCKRGDSSGSAPLSDGWGLAVDTEGNIYVLEEDDSEQLYKYVLEYTETFTIDDASPDDGDAILNSYTTAINQNGIYTLTEHLTGNWITDSIVCQSTLHGEIINVATSSVGISINADEAIICTVTNSTDPDLAISKSVQATALPSEIIIYTVEVSNLSGYAGEIITIEDTLPAQLDLLNISSSGITLTPINSTNPWQWQVDPMSAGDSGVLTITAQIPVTITTETLLTNSVAITTVNDTDVSNNSASASTTVLIPSIVVTKTAGVYEAAIGDTITYAYVIHNTGGTPLEIAATDDVLGELSGYLSPLPAGQTTTVFAEHIVTEDDVYEPLVNTVFVTGTTYLGDIVTATDSAWVDVFGAPEFALDKSVFGYDSSTITWTIFVENIGDITGDVVVTDTFPSGVSNAGCEYMDPATGAIVSTVGDLNELVTLAALDAVEFLCAGSFSAGITATQSPISQTIPSGTTATFTVTVTNTGSVTLTEVTVSDFPASTTCERSNITLTPGEVLTYTCTDVVSAENYSSTVAATGKIADVINRAAILDLGSFAVELPSDGVDTGMSFASVEVDDFPINLVRDTAVADLSTIDVNSGATPPSYVALSPPATGSVTIINVATPADGTDFGFNISPALAGISTFTLDDEAENGGANSDGIFNTVIITHVVSGVYTITESTTPGWALNNIVCTDSILANSTIDIGAQAATIMVESGENVVCLFSNTKLDIAISLDKQLLGNLDNDDSGTISIGDQITYTFLVENNGEALLNNIAVTDDLIESVACPQAILAPTESMLCSATYTVTQQDLDNGQILNSASVRGSGLAGDEANATDIDILDIPQRSSLDLVKTMRANADDDDSGSVTLDDWLTYEFIVTNNSNVTLNNVTVADPLVGLSDINCDPQTNGSITLLPGEQATCLATYQVMQTDVDNGTINNLAVATAVGPNGEIDDPGASEIDVAQNPSIDLQKTMATSIDADESGTVSSGDTLTYQFDIANDGTLTLSDVMLVDPLLNLSTIDCEALVNGQIVLAPGETARCTATYVVTDLDATNGQIINNAIVRGNSPNGDDPSAEDSVQTVVAALPGASPLAIFDPYICGGPIYGNVTGGEPPFTVTLDLRTASTAADAAAYTFTVAVNPDGTWQQPLEYSDQTASNYVLPNDYTNTYSVMDSAGQTASGSYDLTIGQCPAETFTLTGMVWLDQNGDGFRSGAEEGMQGHMVILYDSTGNEIDTVQTNADGSYRFTVESDDYSIDVEPRSGYIAPDGPQSITISPDNAESFIITNRVVEVAPTALEQIAEPSIDGRNSRLFLPLMNQEKIE